MDIELAQDRGAGVNEPMRRVRRNDDDAARFYLALFVTDRDGGSAFESECDFDVGTFVQRRALPGLSLDDVGRERVRREFRRRTHTTSRQTAAARD
jgi:hypothetical protein